MTKVGVFPADLWPNPSNHQARHTLTKEWNAMARRSSEKKHRAGAHLRQIVAGGDLREWRGAVMPASHRSMAAPTEAGEGEPAAAEAWGGGPERRRQQQHREVISSKS